MELKDVKIGMTVIHLWTNKVGTVSKIHDNNAISLSFKGKDQYGSYDYASSVEPFPTSVHETIILIKKYKELQTQNSQLVRDYNRELDFTQSLEKKIDKIIENNNNLANTLSFYTDLVKTKKIKITE